MPGHLPILDRAALIRLRQYAKELHGTPGRSVPHEAIVQLARDVRLDAGVTIDFEAAEELGEPLVVLRVKEQTSPAACLDGLSKREREVTALVADGLSNKQVAGRLFISLATVKDHVHRILNKTGLSNRAALAAASRGHAPQS